MHWVHAEVSQRQYVPSANLSKPLILCWQCLSPFIGSTDLWLRVLDSGAHTGWLAKRDSSKINNYWEIFGREINHLWRTKLKPFVWFQLWSMGAKANWFLIVYRGEHWCFSWQARALYCWVYMCKCAYVCVCARMWLFRLPPVSRSGRSWGLSCGVRSGRAAGPSRVSGCPAGLLVCSCDTPWGRPSLQCQARWAKLPTGQTARTGHQCKQGWDLGQMVWMIMVHRSYLSYSELVIKSRVVQAKF